MRKKRVKGYLTIYLSLTLMLMLSLCLTLIDGARRSSVRLEAECITDTAMYSVMAEYHRELFAQYNLFYIDSSYGSSYPSFYNTQARLQYYLEQNTKEEDGTYFDFLYEDLLGLKLLESVVEKVAFATDDEGRRFQKKAAEVVLEDVGAGLAEEVLSWVGVVNDHGLTDYDIASKKQEVEREIGEIVEKKASQEDSVWTAEVKTPMEYVSGFLTQGVLQSVLGSQNISDGYADLSGYISERRNRGDINCGNWSEQELSVTDKILFHEYLLRYAGYYGQEKEAGLLKYQVEYLIGGKSTDRENLTYTLSVLLTIRSAANVTYLYSDSEKMETVRAVAAVLAAAVLAPELESVFETALILGWAYVESLYDVKVLAAGGRVPLLKESRDWHYDLDSILDGVDMQVQDTNESGLSYKDYLHVLLYLMDEEEVTFRFLDIVEMDIRQTRGNENFRIDGCIECMEIRTVFCARSGYKHEVTAQIAYD